MILSVMAADARYFLDVSVFDPTEYQGKLYGRTGIINTPIVAKPSSAISITAVEVEGYLLPCIRT